MKHPNDRNRPWVQATPEVESAAPVSGSQPAHNPAHDVIIQPRNAKKTAPPLLRGSGNALMPTLESSARRIRRQPAAIQSP